MSHEVWWWNSKTSTLIDELSKWFSMENWWSFIMVLTSEHMRHCGEITVGWWVVPGVMLSATFEIIMILHLGMGSSSTTKASPTKKGYEEFHKPQLFRKRMKKASDCVCPTQKLKKMLSPHTWPCLELFGPQVKKDYSTIIALFTRQLSLSKWQSKWRYTPVYGTKP
jgi:hypothetical protein